MTDLNHGGMMLNDRDEQHYDHEESEYHFSDDEVSYEVETEPSKQAAPEQTAKKSPASNLSPSKRMLIAVVVFVGLIFVIYKMVSPGSSVPSTDISPVATQAAAPALEPPPIANTVPVASAKPAPVPAATTPAQPMNTPAAVSSSTAMLAPSAPVATTMPTTQQPAAAPQQAAATQVITTAQAPAAPAPQPAAPVMQQSAPVQAQPVQPAPPTTAAQSMPAAPQPVASQAMSAIQPQPVTTIVTSAPTTSPTSSTDAAMAAMVATNEKLMNQLQTEYQQKAADFNNQTKAMQDQMQTLSSRVAGLESQLSQLVQTLTRQSGMGNSSLNVLPAQQPAPPPQQIAAPKINYNVQAIIPGRAWLKADNGETLTVAEGDSIKELGRVTKIDPYDGVVEVNTGNKTVSISYGNGG